MSSGLSPQKAGIMHVSVNIEMNGHCTALVGFVRAPVTAAVARDPRGRLAFSALRMGGGNVPRVPYKAPGEQGYQVRNGYLGAARLFPGGARTRQ
jgi:hypothetical protein